MRGATPTYLYYIHPDDVGSAHVDALRYGYPQNPSEIVQVYFSDGTTGLYAARDAWYWTAGCLRALYWLGA
jgi:hypothetical protein